MIHKYAAVVEGDVFYILDMDDDNQIGAKWSAALDSGLIFINVNNYPQVKPGFLYKDGLFYMPDDLNMENPLSEIIPENDTKNQFAGIVENDVIGLMTFQKSEMIPVVYEMIDTGFRSNPTIVNFTNFENKNEILAGWTWDGTNFHPPA